MLQNKVKSKLYSSSAKNFKRMLQKRNLYNKHFIQGIQKMSDLAIIKGLNDSTFAGLYINTSSFKGGDKDATDISSIDFKIIDTFADYNTNSLLYGKELTNYAKNVLLALIHHLSSNYSQYVDSTAANYKTKKEIHEIFKSQLSNKQTTFTSLKNSFESKSVECFLAYALLAYQSGKNDLMLRLMYTYGRVLPLTHRTEWFDNYRLNAYGNVLNTIMREHVISESVQKTNNVYTVAHEIKPIDTSVQINYNKMVKFLVGSVREYIIKHNLLASDELCSSELTLEQILNIQSKAKPLSAKEVCDIAYEHYPFYYGGAHGCDCFDIDLAPTIDEITKFLSRYPSAKVGFILNTATYKSGRGQHWVALMLSKGVAQLICSQKGDFSNFADGGALLNALRRNNFELKHNSIKFQNDNYSCGMQSAISLLQLLQYGSIEATVSSIGEDMSKLGSKGASTDLVIEKLAGTSQNT